MPDPAPTPTAIEVNARNFLSAKSSVWQCSEAGGGAEDVEHLQVQHDLPHNAPSGSGLDDDARQETKSCKPPVRHLRSIRPSPSKSDRSHRNGALLVKLRLCQLHIQHRPGCAMLAK